MCDQVEKNDDSVALDNKKHDTSGVEEVNGGSGEVVYKGHIKFFVRRGGYGFIRATDNETIENKDVFFHRFQLKAADKSSDAEKIKTGRMVRFTIGEGRSLKVGWFSVEDEQDGGARKWPKDVEVSAGKQLGTVKWFNCVKGWGFIKPLAGGEDVFVHQSNIIKSGFRSLREGEEVEFNIIEDAMRSRMIAGFVSGPNGSDVQGTHLSN